MHYFVDIILLIYSYLSTIQLFLQIPDVPKRERLALELSEKASKLHRAKKEEALRQVTRRFAR